MTRADHARFALLGRDKLPPDLLPEFDARERMSLLLAGVSPVDGVEWVRRVLCAS